MVTLERGNQRPIRIEILWAAPTSPATRSMWVSAYMGKYPASQKIAGLERPSNDVEGFRKVRGSDLPNDLRSSMFGRLFRVVSDRPMWVWGYMGKYPSLAPRATHGTLFSKSA